MNTENIYIAGTSFSKVLPNKSTNSYRLYKLIARLEMIWNRRVGKTNGIAAVYQATMAGGKNRNLKGTLYNGSGDELKVQRDFEREFRREMTKISVRVNNWI